MHPEQLEQMVEVAKGRRCFTLGLPKAAPNVFPRIVLTPEGVSILTSRGIDVIIQKDFGTAIKYDDQRYLRAGARIVEPSHVWQADMVLTPDYPDPDSVLKLKRNSILLTLSNNRILDERVARVFMMRNITVVALDRVTDRHHLCPVADILGEVSGRAAVTAAIGFLATPEYGKGILLGGVAGVNPCEVVILGTGMAALSAARSSIGLGAMVRLFDSDPYCLRAAINELGGGVIGSNLHPAVLGHALASADVVIATRLSRGFAVDDSVIDSMKKGVVIIDINDHNGISGTFPTLRCIDVIDAQLNRHPANSRICLINPGATVQRTASMAMTNDVIPIIDRLIESGGLINVLKTDGGLRNATLFFGGRAVDREIASRLHLRGVDINLLLTFS